MSKRIGCQGHECVDRAVLRVVAFGGKSWSGFYCAKHAGRIIKLRTPLIKKYKQNVVIRLISDRDRAALSARKRKG